MQLVRTTKIGVGRAGLAAVFTLAIFLLITVSPSHVYAINLGSTTSLNSSSYMRYSLLQESPTDKEVAKISTGGETISGETYFFKTGKKRKQTFSLGVKTNSDGKLTYKSDNPYVKVSANGKVTIVKGYIGDAEITIKVAETASFKAAKKKVAVIVELSKPVIKSVTSPGKGRIKITWNSVACAEAYQVHISTSHDFTNAKIVNVTSPKKTSLKISDCISGKRYYFKIDAWGHADVRVSSIKSVRVK